MVFKLFLWALGFGSVKPHWRRLSAPRPPLKILLPVCLLDTKNLCIQFHLWKVSTRKRFWKSLTLLSQGPPGCHPTNGSAVLVGEDQWLREQTHSVWTQWSRHRPADQGTTSTRMTHLEVKDRNASEKQALHGVGSWSQLPVPFLKSKVLKFVYFLQFYFFFKLHGSKYFLQSYFVFNLHGSKLKK